MKKLESIGGNGGVYRCQRVRQVARIGLEAGSRPPLNQRPSAGVPQLICRCLAVDTYFDAVRLFCVSLSAICGFTSTVVVLFGSECFQFSFVYCYLRFISLGDSSGPWFRGFFFFLKKSWFSVESVVDGAPAIWSAIGPKDMNCLLVSSRTRCLSFCLL